MLPQLFYTPNSQVPHSYIPFLKCYKISIKHDAKYFGISKNLAWENITIQSSKITASRLKFQFCHLHCGRSLLSVVVNWAGRFSKDTQWLEQSISKQKTRYLLVYGCCASICKRNRGFNWSIKTVIRKICKVEAYEIQLWLEHSHGGTNMVGVFLEKKMVTCLAFCRWLKTYSGWFWLGKAKNLLWLFSCVEGVRKII